MIKFIGKLLTLLVAVIFGFWLATTNILMGTRVGDWMDTLMGYLPGTDEQTHIEVNLPSVSERLSHFPDWFTEEPADEEMDEESAESSITTRQAQSENTEVDYGVVEAAILESLNELRVEQDLNPLTANDELREAATIRAIETEELFSHTRPDGSDAFTVFEEDDITYNYQLVGENLGMATNYLEEQEMADLLFNGWVESEGHYENMIRPEYQEVGIGVHYDGEYLYATQMFGTQM